MVLSNDKIANCKYDEVNEHKWRVIINRVWVMVYLIAALGNPFFPGGPELWHHPLAYSAAGELPGTLQHAALVHPALHPQVPVRSYLWLSADKALEPPTSAPMHVSDSK